MRSELELITASASIHATSADIDKIDNILCEVTDCNYLLDMMVKNCTAGLLYRKLPLLKNINLIPIDIQKLLKKAYQTTFIHNTRIYTEFVYLKEILQLHRIPFITLKGICMAEWLYADIGLRQMSDIDLLIQEKDGVRCLDTLLANGYAIEQKYSVNAFVDLKSHHHFNPLFRNGVMVEIHTKLQNSKEIYRQNLQEVWRDAVPIILNGVETLRLELSDMLIHACLHLDKHFVTEGVQFTSFNDIVNLLREIEDRTKNKEQRIKTEEFGQKSKEQRIKTEEIENFWERFEAKCIQYNFADTVFRYLVMVRYYYGAPLPDYLYEKYGENIEQRTKNKDGKSEDYIRFENFLAGTGNEFIGRGAPKSSTEAHLLHLKQLKNPVDFIKYVKGVVFPGKAFMVSKYIESQEPRTKSKDEGNMIKESKVEGRKSEEEKLRTQNLKLKYWFLWYPYRWAMGLRGFWLVITKNTIEKK